MVPVFERLRADRVKADGAEPRIFIIGPSGLDLYDILLVIRIAMVVSQEVDTAQKPPP